MSIRDAARRYIEAVLYAEPGTEAPVLEEVAEASPEDRAFFQELTHGAIREWLYLDWVIAKYAPKPPRGTLQSILNLSAYQLLFLDRVPDYAIFSQAAAIASALGVSEPELKFVHGVLKTVQRNKDKLLEIRASSLERARQGLPPEGALELAVLNSPPNLIDALTVVEEKGQKKAARGRAARALAAMKERGRMIGYVLPGGAPKSIIASLDSAVAPRARILSPSPMLSEDLRGGVVRVQGEASQWACELAAQHLEKLRGQGPLRILEMTAGKGGKLVGTLAAWTAIWGGNREALPPIEWVATDSSSLQLRVLELDAVPLVRRLWPQVTVRSQLLDWRHPGEKAPQPASFDLVWLDAPCTGFGTLAKLPQIALRRGLKAYEEALSMAEIQQQLAAEGVTRLKPGAGLLYTVCTLTRPETVGLVEFAASKLGRSPGLAQALWPGSPPAPEAEGFFAALL